MSTKRAPPLTDIELVIWRWRQWASKPYVAPLFWIGDTIMSIALLMVLFIGVYRFWPEQTTIYVGMGLKALPPQVVQMLVSKQVKASTSVDAKAWQTIRDATALEDGCDAKLVYAVWTTETNDVDCSAPGADCVSSAGAQGPLQFMPATWPQYAESDWDVWSLHDSTRAACRMNADLRLQDQQSREAFATRFSGGDGGACWNCGSEGYNQALQVWDTWKSFNAVVLSMPAEGVIVTMNFGQKYPDMPELRKLGLVGMPHDNGVDFAIPSGESFTVVSPVDGVVTEVIKNTPCCGTIVKIQLDSSPDALIELWHLDSDIKVSAGQDILVGDEIGTAVGAGESSTGPHLHLRLIINGVDADPIKFMESGP